MILLSLQKKCHKWAGIGDEIGKAVNSSLSAVTTQANNFGQTGSWKDNDCFSCMESPRK